MVAAVLPMQRSKSLTARDRLVAELDRATSIIVIRAYGVRCVVCSWQPGWRKPDGSSVIPPDEARRRRFIECGHVFGRTHHSTRWDIHWSGNCYPQCPRCNFDHNDDREPYLAWYRRTFGAVRLAALEQRWHRQRKFTDPELAELATYYQAIIAGQAPLPVRQAWPRLAFDALEVIPPHQRDANALQAAMRCQGRDTGGVQKKPRP